MSFNEALSYLLSLGHETLTIKLGLENTETLLQALGNPQNEFPAVQVAGTNGKGSTAVMLDSICRAAGLHTGLFTSPHLISITERIKIGGEPISEPDFARFTSEVQETAEALVARKQLQTLPTFFEQVTAIALVAFREAKVELAILETGLGGRLDSTTAVGARVVAITPIAMDHEEYLGHTIAEIAAEKAAIIRAGVNAVIGPQVQNALDVILNRCRETEVHPLLVQSAFDTANRHCGAAAFCRARFLSATSDGRCRATFETSEDIYEKIQLGLRGRHQIENAATALSLALQLRKKGLTIPDAAIIEGLAAANHPGRLELWPAIPESAPQILFDGAHNVAAAEALAKYLDEFGRRPRTMIFAVMSDKDLSSMAAILFPRADQLVLTQLDNPRAASLEILQSAASASFDQGKIRLAESAADALRIARKMTSASGMLCVTGSLYLVGAIRALLPKCQKPDR
jgi:dihydrofolate synthase/folylpolyglutamate synthase